MDATSAFNKLNHHVPFEMLKYFVQCLHLCILINTYYQDAFLFTEGHTNISTESMTQAIHLKWPYMLLKLYL